jgi:diguanylate cyclase (GGDEF)-like protein
MIPLDISTIILMASLSSGTMSIVLWAAQRSFPPEIKGLGWWTGASLCFMLGRLLIWLRPLSIPDWLGVIGANGLLLWGMAMCLVGTRQFYGQRAGWTLWHAVALSGMLGIVWGLWIRPDMGARVIAFSLANLALDLALFLTIVRHGARHFSSWFFATLVLVQMLALTLRVVGFSHEGANPADVNTLYLAVVNIMSLMLAVGFMTVAIEQLQRLLEQRANLDPLTGTLNRRGFTERYMHEVARMKREPDILALLSIDLDHFKTINDQFGHATGDKVLIHVTGMIRHALRETDTLGRFGGEEFIVLLPRTGIATAQTVAQRIQHLLGVVRTDGLPVCTASIGIAAQHTAGATLDSLLAAADRALYAAKAAGRNRIELAA